MDGRPSTRLSKYWPDKPRPLVTSILTKHSVPNKWDSVSTPTPPMRYQYHNR